MNTTDRPVVTMHITTEVKAPAKYGKNTYKINVPHGFLLIEAGWTLVAKGRAHFYVRAPEGVSGTVQTITLPAPTNREIHQLAMDMHRQGKAQQRVVEGFVASYHPQQHQPRRITATFEFGWRAPWGVMLIWAFGVDNPPVWDWKDANGTYAP